MLKDINSRLIGEGAELGAVSRGGPSFEIAERHGHQGVAFLVLRSGSDSESVSLADEGGEALS